ncbi:MAG: 7-carboxy-7-deazaguanine synthase [Gemmatimonadota bacterium]|nr:MAG: 7-carboxy-7-deazaguanine synthase [Gemmatimonadota bacterium]
MTYTVKEVYYSLQGEGANTGRAAVFLRFAGCNLWTGREADRATAVCSLCDTDIVGTDGPGGGKFASAAELADAVAAKWRRADGDTAPRGSEAPGQGDAGPPGSRLVVCTGGEPALQLDDELIAALKARGFAVAIETNGTVASPDGLDWICVSPKVGTDLVQSRGDELKLVYPQDGVEPSQYEQLDFTHFWLQPLDGPDRDEHTELAVSYCLQHPRWRLSLQTHKILGIP